MLQQKEVNLYMPLTKRVLVHCMPRSGVHTLKRLLKKNGELAEESYQDLEFNLLKPMKKAEQQLDFPSS